MRKKRKKNLPKNLQRKKLKNLQKQNVLSVISSVLTATKLIAFKIAKIVISGMNAVTSRKDSKTNFMELAVTIPPATFI